MRASSDEKLGGTCFGRKVTIKKAFRVVIGGMRGIF
jgi:hypothetical protein